MEVQGVCVDEAGGYTWWKGQWFKCFGIDGIVRRVLSRYDVHVSHCAVDGMA